MGNVVPFPTDEGREFRLEVVPYAENADFNDALDAQYGAVEIDGVSFQPSLVLHTMDPEAYRANLLGFRQEQLDDLKELIIHRFPTPIASRFDKVENGCATYLERLSVLKDVWEALTYTLYAILVSEFRSLSLPLRDATVSLPPKTETLKYSNLYSDKLAYRIGIMSGLLQLALDRTLDTVFTQIVSVDVLERIRSLNKARNGFAHDETKSEEQARALFTESYEDVLSVFRQLQGLANVALLRFHGTERRVLCARFEEFVGHAMTRHYRTVNLTVEQHARYAHCLTEDTVVVMYEGRIYGLSPFLYFVSRDEGNITKLCFFKKKEGEGTKQVYLFSVVGESKNEKIPAVTFAVESDQLKDLCAPASGAVTS